MWKDILAGFVRHGLTILATWLVSRGIIDSEIQKELVGRYAEVTSYIVQAFILLAPFFLSLAQKVRARVKLSLALGGERDEEVLDRTSKEVPLTSALRGQIRKADSTPDPRFPG